MVDEEIAGVIRLVLHGTTRAIRNSVAHDGYLPTREETSQALEEARQIIYGLSERLNLRDAERYRL